MMHRAPECPGRHEPPRRRRRPRRPRRGGAFRLIRNILLTVLGLVALFYLIVFITGWIR